MSRYTKAFSSFSTNNLEAARKFYTEDLEIETKETDGFLELHIGGQEVLIYPKDDHEPATFTVLNLYVQDLEMEVANLKHKGVPFESYDTPGIKTNEQDILEDMAMQMKIAWFRDPAGNILSLIQQRKHINH